MMRKNERRNRRNKGAKIIVATAIVGQFIAPFATMQAYASALADTNATNTQMTQQAQVKSGDPAAIANVPDAAFKAGLNAALGQSADAEMTVGQLNSLTGPIQIKSKGIVDITGIEHLINVKEVNLSGNQISNLNALDGVELPLLQMLYFQGNQIVDISGLMNATLPELALIDVSSNQIVEADFTTANFPKLQELHMQLNKLERIEGFDASSWPVLSRLFLNDNQLGNIDTVLNSNLPSLVNLSASGNKITNLPSLSGVELPKLQQLYLQYNELEDVKWLTGASFPSLTTLSLQYNKLASLDGIAEANFPTLSNIRIFSNALTDLNGFIGANLPSLYKLEAHYNQIADITGLQGLSFPKLRYLYLNSNKLTDIKALEAMSAPTLGYLYVQDNQIQSFPQLGNLPLLSSSDFARQSPTLKMPATWDAPKVAFVNPYGGDDVKEVTIDLMGDESQSFVHTFDYVALKLGSNNISKSVRAENTTLIVERQLTPSIAVEGLDVWSQSQVDIEWNAEQNATSKAPLDYVILPDETIVDANSGASLSGIYTVTENGKYSFAVVDKDGERADFEVEVATIDAEAPILEFSEYYDGATKEWVITATASDVGSGMDSILLPNGVLVGQSSANYRVSEVGAYSFEAVDSVGNRVIQTYEVKDIAQSVITATPTTEWSYKNADIFWKIDESLSDSNWSKVVLPNGQEQLRKGFAVQTEGIQEFQKSAKNTYYTDIIATSTGGYATVGYYYPTTSNADGFFEVYDSNGVLKISKSWTGSDSEIPRAVVETKDGGFIVAGQYGSTYTGAILTKYSASGVFQWSHTLNYTFLYDIAELSTGELVIVGQTTTSFDGNKGGTDAVMLKYTSSGTRVWGRNIGGTSSDERLTSVAIGQNDEIIAGGFTSSTIAGLPNHGGQEALVVQYNASGAQQWMSSFGGTGRDYFEDISVSESGYIYAVGGSQSVIPNVTNGGGTDAVIVQFDSNGKQKWAKGFEREGEYNDFYSVTAHPELGIIAVGRAGVTGSNGVVVGYDESGGEVVVSESGTKDVIYRGVDITAAGTVLTAGSSYVGVYSPTVSAYATEHTFTPTLMESFGVYSVSENGTYEFAVIDEDGQWSVTKAEVNTIDRVSPSIETSIAYNEATESWELSISAVDAESGVAYIKLPNGAIIPGSSAVYEVSKIGDYSIAAYDNAGNMKMELISVTDEQAPVITANVSQGWSQSSIDILWKAEELKNGSGLSHVILPDGSIVNELSGTYPATENGMYTFEAFDKAGNQSSVVVSVTTIDREKPELVVEQNYDAVTEEWVLTASASDAQSGIDGIFLPDGTKVQHTTASYRTSKNGTYSFLAIDNVGNSEAVVVQTVVEDTKAPTLSGEVTTGWSQTHADIFWSANEGLDESGLSHLLLPNGEQVSLYSAERMFAKTNWNGEKWDAYYDTVVGTSDGGFVQGGEKYIDSEHGYEAVLTKFDADGNIIWENQLLGVGGNDAFLKVIEVSDGGIVATGYGEDGLRGPAIKFDADGNEVWRASVQFEDETLERFHGVGIVELSDGGLLISGYVRPREWVYYWESGEHWLSEKNIATLIKLDSNGVQQWSKVSNLLPAEKEAKSKFDDVAVMPDGGFVTIGSARVLSSQPEEIGSSYIVRYDANGNELWRDKLTASSNVYLDAIATNDAGDIFVLESTTAFEYPYLGGFGEAGALKFNTFIARYSDDGEKVWLKKVPNFELESLEGTDMEIAQDGTLLLALTDWTQLQTRPLRVQGVMLKMDMNGEILWSDTYGGNDFEEIYGVAELRDGSIVGVGITYSTDLGTSEKPEDISVGSGLILKYSDAKIGYQYSDTYRVTENGLYTFEAFDKAGNQSSVVVSVTTIDREAPVLTVEKDYNEATDTWTLTVQSVDGQSGAQFIAMPDGSMVAGDVATYEVAKVGTYKFSSVDAVGNKATNEFVIEDEYPPTITADVTSGWSQTHADIFWDVHEKLSGSGLSHVVLPDGTVIKASESKPQTFASEADMPLSVIGVGGSYSEYFYGVSESTDGGYVVVGNSSSDTLLGMANKGYDDAIIAKYSKDGEFEWVNSFGGSDSDYFYGVVTLSDGGYVAVGQSASTDAGFANMGKVDAVIVKYDSSGKQEWVKSLGGEGTDALNDVVATQDGGFAVVGDSNSANIESSSRCLCGVDGVIAKYDKDGNQQWIEKYSQIDSDYFNSIATTKSGDLVVAGYSRSTEQSGLILKYSINGSKIWETTIGGNAVDIIYGVAVLNDGSIVGVGEGYSTDIGFNGSGEGWIIHLDENGVEQSSQILEGLDNWDTMKGVAATQDGGYIVAGSVYSTVFEGIPNKSWDMAVALKYDAKDNQEWINVIDGDDEDIYKDILQLSSGNYIAVGASYSWDIGFEKQGQYDAIIATIEGEAVAKETIHQSSGTYTVEENGSYMFTAVDMVGNEASVTIEVTTIDREGPTMTVEISSTTPESSVLQVTAIDNQSGVASLILPDGSSVVGDSSTFTAIETGLYTVAAVDNVGNYSFASIRVSLDKGNPVVEIVSSQTGDWTNQDVEIQIFATDN